VTGALKDAPLRGLLRLLSPAGPNARLSILIYHRVLPQIDPLFPNELDAAGFEAQMRDLSSCFHFIPLGDAVAGLRNGTLPERAACITFDDGYADNAEIALPILRRLGIPATFFVATGFLNGGRMWNDTVIETIRRAPGDRLDLEALGLGAFDLSSVTHRQQAIPALLGKLKYLELGARLTMVERVREAAGVALPDDLMMSSAQVRQLHAAGMEIGGHTVNHPILTRLAAQAARAEIGDGKARLEEIVGAPVRLFAYPNGKPNQDYAADHARIARDLGFTAAVSTAWGAANAASDPFQLPRFTPWDRSRMRFLLRMAQNLRRDGETATA
jgi:peptidoglycan/xylan/chitin deacetylase (PgdA/CDA1 family)